MIGGSEAKATGENAELEYSVVSVRTAEAYSNALCIIVYYHEVA